MRGVSGVTGAGPLWNRIMLHLYDRKTIRRRSRRRAASCARRSARRPAARRTGVPGGRARVGAAAEFRGGCRPAMRLARGRCASSFRATATSSCATHRQRPRCKGAKQQLALRAIDATRNGALERRRRTASARLRAETRFGRCVSERGASRPPTDRDAIA